MKRYVFLLGLTVLAAGVLMLQVPSVPAAGPETTGTPYSLDASYIEACSCNLFCPCYFNDHAQHPYCEFNMAVRVNDGMFGDVSLKGVRYWLTGDLGEHWGTEGKGAWLVVTFDPAVSQEQRDGLVKILGKLYPLQWAKVETDESAFTWTIQGNEARAKLANGKGEMILERQAGADGGRVVLTNVRYFGASSNNGFVLYKSKLNRWDGFGHKFEQTGRNAFTIRLQAEGTL